MREIFIYEHWEGVEERANFDNISNKSDKSEQKSLFRMHVVSACVWGSFTIKLNKNSTNAARLPFVTPAMVHDFRRASFCRPHVDKSNRPPRHTLSKIHHTMPLGRWTSPGFSTICISRIAASPAEIRVISFNHRAKNSPFVLTLSPEMPRIRHRILIVLSSGCIVILITSNLT